MIRRTTTSISIVAIITFLISLVPQLRFHIDHPDQLKMAIIQVQKLQAISDDSTNNLNRTFAKAISGLHVAAGMNTVIAKTVDIPDSVKSQLVVSFRIPYLLADNFLLDIDDSGRKLPETNTRDHYTSYIPPPETPPPLVV